MTTIKQISKTQREVTGYAETWVEIKCSVCGHWTPEIGSGCVICGGRANDEYDYDDDDELPQE